MPHTTSGGFPPRPEVTICNAILTRVCQRRLSRGRRAAVVIQRAYRRHAVARAARGAQVVKRLVADAIRRGDRESLAVVLGTEGARVLAGVVPGAIRMATREHVDMGHHTQTTGVAQNDGRGQGNNDGDHHEDDDEDDDDVDGDDGNGSDGGDKPRSSASPVRQGTHSSNALPPASKSRGRSRPYTMPITGTDCAHGDRYASATRTEVGGSVKWTRARVPPLHVAAVFEMHDAIAVLLDDTLGKGTGVSGIAAASMIKERDAGGLTAADRAAALGNRTACVSIMRAASAQGVPAEDSGPMALHLAASGSHAALVADLLGVTEARPEGPIAHSRALFPASHGDGDGLPAIAAAAFSGSLRCVEVLLAVPSDARVINTRDSLGRTALHAAVAGGRASERCVPLLLDAGADPNIGDSFNRTPLHWCVEYTSASNCHALLRAGARVDARDAEGTTPLLAATSLGRMGLIPILVAAGADPGARDVHGRGILHLAATAPGVFTARNTVQACLALTADEPDDVDVGVDIEDGGSNNNYEANANVPPSSGGETQPDAESSMSLQQTPVPPSPVAPSSGDGAGRPPVVRHRPVRRFNPDPVDARGTTPLAYACAWHRPSAAAALLDAGADANADDADGWRPLHWAALHVSPRLVGALVRRGADTKALARARTGREMTPEDLVTRAGEPTEPPLYEPLGTFGQRKEECLSLLGVHVPRTPTRRGVTDGAREPPALTPIGLMSPEMKSIVMSPRGISPSPMVRFGGAPAQQNRRGVAAGGGRDSPADRAAGGGGGGGGTPKHSQLREKNRSPSPSPSPHPRAVPSPDGRATLDRAQNSLQAAEETQASVLEEFQELRRLHEDQAVAKARREFEAAEDRETLLRSLHDLVRANDPSGVSELVDVMEDRGVGIDEPPSKWNNQTALHVAAMKNHIAVAKTLMDAGAAVTALDVSGSTPLHYAAAEGSLLMVRMMVRVAGRAEINRPNEVEGCTALHIAARFNKAQVVSFLLSQGAKRGLADRHGRTALRVAQVFKAKDALRAIKKSDKATSTFHASIRTHNDAHVDALLRKKKSHARSSDYSGLSALHTAAASDNPHALGRIIAVKADLEDPTAVQVGTGTLDGDPLKVVRPGGQTALHLASSRGLLNAMDVLLRAGANPNSRDPGGCTPLHVAAFADRDVACRFLGMWGADWDARNVYGWSPVHIAAAVGATSALQRMVKEGADPGRPVGGGKHNVATGETPLALAMRYGRDDCIKYLREIGAAGPTAAGRKMTRVKGHAPAPPKPTTDRSDLLLGVRAATTTAPAGEASSSAAAKRAAHSSGRRGGPATAEEKASRRERERQRHRDREEQVRAAHEARASSRARAALASPNAQARRESNTQRNHQARNAAASNNYSHGNGGRHGAVAAGRDTTQRQLDLSSPSRRGGSARRARPPSGSAARAPGIYGGPSRPSSSHGPPSSGSGRHAVVRPSTAAARVPIPRTREDEMLDSMRHHAAAMERDEAIAPLRLPPVGSAELKRTIERLRDGML